MNKEEIKEYLLDFRERKFPEIIEREMGIERSNKVKSIIGPRRSGKTYFLYQKMKEILKTNERMGLIYLNFEDTRLIDLSFKEIREVIKLYWQIYPESTGQKLTLFFDEPQNIQSWEVSVRSLHDEGFEIYLSGSSSKLLSKEIATSLRGRTFSYLLLPFSFREFLKAKDVYFNIARLTSREKSLLLSLSDKYLEAGGFPEIVLEKEEGNRMKILKEYLDLVVYRDIIERYKIKNTKAIQWLIKSLITAFSKEISIHKIYLTLKSNGVKVSKNTLYSYLSMLEDSFFVFSVPRFEHSIRKRDLSINKIYLCDIGFVKIIEISEDKGKKMENIVFLELERRKKALTEIFYWKNQQKEEVDFVIKTGRKVGRLIQVCRNLEDGDTKKREIRALLKASKELKCNNLLIITEDKDGEERIKNKKIGYIPLWKWLLKG